MTNPFQDFPSKYEAIAVATGLEGSNDAQLALLFKTKSYTEQPN
jgi:hypothetical protein